MVKRFGGGIINDDGDGDDAVRVVVVVSNTTPSPFAVV